MNVLARFVRLVRGLFRRRREDDETTEELRFHRLPIEAALRRQNLIELASALNVE